MLYVDIIWVRVEIKLAIGYWVHILGWSTGSDLGYKKSGSDLDLVLTVLLEYFDILSHILKVQSY